VTGHAPNARSAPPERKIRSILVVGAGLAGFGTVRALREHSFSGHVTLLGAEGIAPYNRPPLSKELLARTTPEWLAEDQRFDLDAAVDDLRLGEPAIALTVSDTSAEVTSSAGTYRADAVVLACGARARRPAGWESALTLHTAADADALRAALGTSGHLVCIGAGWIGGELAGVARAAGHQVTVIEAGVAPLAGVLGDLVGGRLGPWYDALDITLVLGTPVAEVTDGRVLLSDRRAVRGDVVVAAVGARPATDWLVGTVPLTPSGSIQVDGGYRVLDLPPHVIAVGDCADRLSARHGWVPGGHWDAALRGPEVAVRTLLGVSDADADLRADLAPYVFSSQLGHELTLTGLPRPGDHVVPREGETGWTALYFAPEPRRGPRELRAVLTVDRPRDVAAARRMFRGAALPIASPRIAADAARDLRDALSQ